MSRADLARATGLSAPTVSKLTADLVGEELAVESAIGSSSGGRPPVLLAFNGAAAHLLGAKLTEDRLLLALTDLDGGFVDEVTVKLPTTQPQPVVDLLAQATNELRRAASGRRILGMGVGLAGVVDWSTGTVRHGTYSGWRDVPLASMLHARTSLPIVVDNDVNTYVAAEQWLGNGRPVGNLVVICIGRGVGMGMVLDGHIYRGWGGGAGELGHTKMDPDGPTCACGAQGCLEALVNEDALEAAAARLGASTLASAIARARDGDHELRAMFDEAGRTLGRAAAHATNILHPQRLVLAGEGARFADLILDGFQAALRHDRFAGFHEDVEVEIHDWGDKAWARGAASLVLSELLQPTHAAPSDRPAPALLTAS